MRDFSLFERNLITSRLLEGSTLSDMLYNNVGGWVVTVFDPPKRPKFEFRSFRILEDPQPSYDQLVDVIELLIYLESQGLIRKYTRAATILSTSGQEHAIFLGNQGGGCHHAVFMPLGAERYGSYIRENEFNFFVALPPLQEFVRRGFRSREFIHAHVANRIALVVALATVIGTLMNVLQNYQSRNEVIEYLRAAERARGDGRDLELLRKDVRNIGARIDSLEQQTRQESAKLRK